MKLAMAAACLAVGLAGAAAGQSGATEVYQCDMTNKGNGGWVGDTIYLTIDRETDRGAAMDFAIFEVHEIPIEVDTVRRKENLWVFRWSVKGVTIGNEGSGTVRYKATLDTAKLTVQLSGNLLGFDNNIYGRGTCRALG